jgi:hypothetical protein
LSPRKLYEPAPSLNRIHRFGPRERRHTDQLICAPVTDRIEGTVPDQIDGLYKAAPRAFFLSLL